MQPQELLDSHELTTQLKSLGVTDRQLEQTQFRSTNAGWPFAQWSITTAADLPLEALPFMKAYCALKWLVLSDPPASRDKDDAWRLVSDTLAAPVFAAGQRHLDSQAVRARKPRGLITEDGQDIKAIIREFCAKPERRQALHKQLWPAFYAELESLGLSPEETDPEHYSYNDFKGRKRHISYKYFANLISRPSN